MASASPWPIAVDSAPRTYGRFVAYPEISTCSRGLHSRVPKERTDSATYHCMEGCEHPKSLQETSIPLPDSTFIAPEAKMVPDSPSRPQTSSSDPNTKTVRTSKIDAIRRKHRVHETLVSELAALPPRQRISRVLIELEHVRSRIESQSNALNAFHAQNEVDHDILDDSIKEAEQRILKELELRVLEGLQRRSSRELGEAQEIAKNVIEERGSEWTAEMGALKERMLETERAVEGLMMQMEAWGSGIAGKPPGVEETEVKLEQDWSELEKGGIRSGAKDVKPKDQGKSAERGPRRSPRKRKIRGSADVGDLSKRRSLHSRRL